MKIISIRWRSSCNPGGSSDFVHIVSNDEMVMLDHHRLKGADTEGLFDIAVFTADTFQDALKDGDGTLHQGAGVMTAKDYRALARVLLQLRKDRGLYDAEGFACVRMTDIEEAFAAFFAVDNPAFDRAKWGAALKKESGQ